MLCLCYHSTLRTAFIQHVLMPCTSSAAALQVNYLGPYHLTRLLEPQLASSAPSRVVNLSSIMHRSGHVDPEPASFLTDWNKGSQYSNTKLANVLFTYEAQRRLAHKGIQVRLSAGTKKEITGYEPVFYKPYCHAECTCLHTDDLRPM